MAMTKCDAIGRNRLPAVLSQAGGMAGEFEKLLAALNITTGKEVLSVSRSLATTTRPRSAARPRRRQTRAAIGGSKQ